MVANSAELSSKAIRVRLLTTESGLHLAAFRALDSDTQWGGAAEDTVLPPGVLRWDSPLAWQVPTVAADREVLRATWRDADGTLSYVCEWRCDDEHPVVTLQGRLTNHGEEAVRVRSWPVVSLPLGMRVGAVQGLGGFQRHEPAAMGLAPIPFRTAAGRVETFVSGWDMGASWLGLHTPDDEDALVIGWVSNGTVFAEIGDRVRSGTVGVHCTWEPDLLVAPGETYTGPLGFCCLAGGGLAEAAYLTHRYIDHRLAAPIACDPLPIAITVVRSRGQAPDALSVAWHLDRAAELGFDVVVVPSGWEDEACRVSRRRFPAGLRPLSDQARKLGMKMGLGFDWGKLAAAALGELRPAEEIPAVPELALGSEDVRAQVARRILEVVDDAGIDWLVAGMPLGALRDRPAAERAAAVETSVLMDGLERVLEHVRHQRPALGLQHCGKRMALLTYRMVQQHHTAIVCEGGDALAARRNLFALSYPLPPRYLGSCMNGWATRYERRSHFLGGPWMVDDAAEALTPDSPAWRALAEDVTFYKSLRGLLREAQVLHLVPPAPERPDWDGWDATGYYSHAADTMVVFVFRARGRLHERVVAVRGLAPRHLYRVRFTDSGEQFQALGEELLHDGLRFALDAFDETPGGHCSEVVLIEPAIS